MIHILAEGGGLSSLLSTGESAPAVPVCAPQCKRGMDMLERVQQKATDMKKVLELPSYEGRLREMGLFS